MYYNSNNKLEAVKFSQEKNINVFRGPLTFYALLLRGRYLFLPLRSSCSKNVVLVEMENMRISSY